MNYKFFFFFLFSFMIVLAFSIFKIKKENFKVEKPNIDLSFIKNVESIISPKFPENLCNVLDYGAVKITENKENKNVEAFKKAIEDCVNKGGGTIKVPAGEFLLNGPIHLKSNINLNLDENSILTFSTNPNDYLPVVKTRYEGIELMNFSPMIYAQDCENVAITGKGIIQKSSENNGWNGFKKNAKKAEKRLYKMSINNVPLDQRVFGKIEDSMRTSFVQPYNSKNVLIEGVTIKDGPMWTLHALYTENLIVRNVKIQTLESNKDGIAIDSCKNVLIENNEISVGDDAIVLKSGKDQDGWRVGKPTENVIIRNNKVLKSLGGAVSIGSEMSGDVKNVLIENLIVEESDFGIRIKSRVGRGGIVENVLVQNSVFKNSAEEVIQVNFFYGSEEDKPATTKEPELKNVKFSNIEISRNSDNSKSIIEVVGLKNRVSAVSFENIKITDQNVFSTIKDIDYVYFENVSNTDFKIENSNVEIKKDTCSKIEQKKSNVKEYCFKK